MRSCWIRVMSHSWGADLRGRKAVGVHASYVQERVGGYVTAFSAFMARPVIVIRRFI